MQVQQLPGIHRRKAATSVPVQVLGRMRPVFSLIWAIVFCSMLNGCNPTSEKEPKPATPEVSRVPLRIWIVDAEANTLEFPDANQRVENLIPRQWAASSEQSLEVRRMSIESCLTQDDCNCDVIVYPSRLVGELLKREWLDDLPQRVLDAPAESEAAESVIDTTLRGVKKRQAEYGNRLVGFPLGISGSVVLAGDTEAAFKTIEDVSAATPGSGESEAASEPAETEISSVEQARLVDQFLAIATQLTDRETKYGLLFNLRPFEPRITSEEFVRAAKLLAQSYKQDPRFVLGSAAERAQLFFDSPSRWVITSPNGIQAAAAQRSSSTAPGQTASTGSPQPAAAVNFERAMRLNHGQGQNISLTMNCRQTQRSIEFIRWMMRESTQSALAPTCSGIDSNRFLSDPTAVAAQRRMLGDFARMEPSFELRIPGATRFRSELAHNLTAYLQGKTDCESALRNTAQSWQKINEELGLQKQMKEYRKSLGITL